MEKNTEINSGSYTTEYRQLDTRIGRWWSNDPVVHAHLSPYNSMDNNPISGIDPYGSNTENTNNRDWKPKVTRKGEIQLIKEKGDNLGTLKQFFYGSNRFTDKEIEDAYNNAKGGIIVELPDDNLSRSYEFAAKNKNLFADPEAGDYGTKDDTYNCYHQCLNGATGSEIYSSKSKYKKGVAYVDDHFIAGLEADFEETKSNPLIYGETVIAIYNARDAKKTGFDKTQYQHGVIYAGQDQKGNIYVFTKDGPRFKPELKTLRDVLQNMPWEDDLKPGDNRGKNTGMHYYRPKRENRPR